MTQHTTVPTHLTYLRVGSILGVVISLLATIENHVPLISAFCGAFGDGCRDTEQYRFIGLPIAPWGMLFYATLALLALRRSPWAYRAVMIGFGFELVMVKIMLGDGFFCVFCVANCLLLIILFLSQFDHRRSWEILALVLLGLVFSTYSITQSRPSVELQNGTQSAETVLARVGDLSIIAADVERPLSTPLYKLRKQIYELQNTVLETRIDDLLLEQKANSQGISFDELIANIRGQIALPSQQIVDHYYESGLYRMWGSWEGSEAEIKAKIKDYIHTRDTDPLLLDYCQQLRKQYKVEIYLTQPPLPLTQVNIAGAPTQGPSNAQVTIVEFSDYLCPACRKGHKVVEQIKQKYAGRIQWAFKDYPLERHPGAKELALAAHCAGEQGKFWEYQALLFSLNVPPKPKEVITYAEDIGLDTNRFRVCLANPELEQVVDESIDEARKAGIGSTPTFIINGRIHSGTPSFDEFSKLIDQALAETELTLPSVKAPVAEPTSDIH